MEYRRLGSSGLRLSELSFGSWVTFHNQVDYEKAKQLMARAYEAGINFFDNAETYANGQSEIVMGKIIKDLGWGRDTFCLSSKVFWGGNKPTQRGLSRKHVRDACDGALKRLGVDYLDLYYCHRPDSQTPIEETVRAMHDLILQGKVLYWGTSEWSAQQIFQAHGIARQYGLTPPTMEQPQYNLLHRQRVEVEYLPCYEELGMGITTWSPLASGILTGKYNNGIPENSRLNLKGYEWLRKEIESHEGQIRLQKVRLLTEIAENRGMNLAQLAIAWCLQNPFVSTVILGASRIEQLEDNLHAAEHAARLDPETLEQLESILQNRPTQPQSY